MLLQKYAFFVNPPNFWLTSTDLSFTVYYRWVTMPYIPAMAPCLGAPNEDH